jgi:hypothetical protein
VANVDPRSSAVHARLDEHSREKLSLLLHQREVPWIDCTRFDWGEEGSGGDEG